MDVLTDHDDHLTDIAAIKIPANDGDARARVVGVAIGVWNNWHRLRLLLLVVLG